MRDFPVRGIPATARRGVALALVAIVLTGAQAVLAPAASAQATPPIAGSGSTWAQNALDQWRRNVEALGLTVNYSGGGSTVGRDEFRSGVVDFAVSEVPYGRTEDGVTDPPPTRGFTYLPVVAGGTGFLYNLRAGNDRIVDLRLSGDTVAKIFTRGVTVWNDPLIAAENPGLTLPAIPIVPVVRSDGSGTTAQFTQWLEARHGPVWDAYCERPACGSTSFYPVREGVEAKAGSLGVTQAVAAQSAQGSITYVESSYARNSGFPVAKVLNDGGYFVEPAAGNVTVALSAAAVRADGTQDLTPVYGNPDPRSYPLSSYSYLIVPTDLQGAFTEDRGRTLSEFAYYALCEGQQQAERLGYAPLPANLVRAGIEQIERVPGTTGRIDPDAVPAGCTAPTDTVPAPAECDRPGPVQCLGGVPATPSPSPEPTPSPSPSASPTPVPSPTPTASPSPRPSATPSVPPRGRSFADRVRRAIAEALARAYDVDPRSDLAPRAQLRQVLRDIVRHAATPRPDPRRTTQESRGIRDHG